MWRLVLSPRWILWHLLAILAVAGCVVAAIWQWGRAGSAMGSALNVGYGVQWPLFAVFFGYMWWRFLRMDMQQHREAAATDGPACTEPAEAEDRPVAPVEPARTVAEDTPLPWDGTPFTRSPLAAPAPVTDAEAPGLAEYNRMLAGLAARDAQGSATERETADDR